jgi:holdfast attachment protein HfaA
MTATRPFGPALLFAALLATSATGAAAQSMDSTGGDFNAGWGRSLGQESRGVTLRNGRDENGNRLIVDGLIQTGEDQSSFSRGDANGSGAGYGGNTAVGNNLAVNVIGSWNTVIVDSTQINNGDVVAGNELNGGVDLND